MRTALHRSGITVRRMLTTHSVTDTRSLDRPRHRALRTDKPYTDSPATALGVVEGRLIASSRDEMQHEFATTEPAPHIDLEAQDITALIGATPPTFTAQSSETPLLHRSWPRGPP